jgi:cytochrome c oxidase subunit 2
MVGKVKVVNHDEYAKWLEGTIQMSRTANAVDGSLAHQGRLLFQKLNCIQCHDPAKGRAPILEEIYMTRRPLKGGGTVVADENYLRKSIRTPRADIREGWEPIMPAFGTDKVSDTDINKVIAYIKSLRKGDTPKRTEDSPPPVGGNTEPQPPAKSTEGGGPK